MAKMAAVMCTDSVRLGLGELPKNGRTVQLSAGHGPGEWIFEDEWPNFSTWRIITIKIGK